MAPPANKRSVAIVGGGIAGLSCAKHLADSSTTSNMAYDVTVYDTGRLRPGGRCSSRQPGDVPKEEDLEYPLLSKYQFDHAAQLISLPQSDDGTSDPRFQDFAKQVDQWLQGGVLGEFPNDSVGRIFKDGTFKPIRNAKFFHGSDGGMGNLPLALLKNKSFDLQQDVWVSPSSGVKFQKNTGKWKLQAKGQTLGIYDELILAHNGKCADRIMSKTPAKDVHALLRVNFSPTVPAYGGKKMTLNSIYSLTICLEKANSPLSKALPESFITGFSSHPNLRMITCQTRKYPDQNDSEYEVWTILSSAKFAKKHKAPQEFLPEDTIENVSTLLLKAVEGSLKIGTPDDDEESSASSIPVLDKRLQLWGAAVPLNVWNNGKGYIYDGSYKVGVCGDWLVEPSIAGAWTSGKLLAEHMLQQQDQDKSEVGLEGSFQRSESAFKLGIASLPQ